MGIGEALDLILDHLMSTGPHAAPLARAMHTLERKAEKLRDRREARRAARFVGCDGCTHFVTKENAAADYNPCQLGHRMAFKTPPYGYSETEDWGFYRPGCRDRDSNAGERISMPS